MTPGLSQSTAAPQPPSQLCVNGTCANTPAPSSGGGAIKWNPGHYMAADTVIYAGRDLSAIKGEMDDLNNHDAILGYRLWITWGALEPSQGQYDFSVVDAVLNRLKTQYNKPKRLVVGLWLYGQNAKSSTDVRVVPGYIQQDKQYGASPVSGSYGWWGKSDSGKSTGMYAPALYNPVVMSRFIAAMQALAQHLDGEPLVEGIYFQEDATIAQAASTFPPADPAYSDGAWLAQLQRLLSATTSSFAHTNVTLANSWFRSAQPGVQMQQWMAANRIAAGSSDTWGQTSLTQYGTSHLSDGIQTLLGASQYGGSDLRGKMPVMVEVQSPDLAGNYFKKYGGPWTPQDLVNAFNTTYKASHVFWTHLSGSETVNGGTVPDAATWGSMVATLTANPLQRTAYPANYP